MKVKNYKKRSFKAYIMYFNSIFPLHIRMHRKTVCPTEILVNSLI